MSAGPTTVVASAARTTTGQSAAIVSADVEVAWIGDSALSLMVNVTAASGTTPTLDLSLQWSSDGGTTWHTPDTAQTFAQITATTAKVKNFAVLGDVYRIVWTVGGTTPSFTFSVVETVN